MAHKSKSQRAKASAARQARKEQKAQEEAEALAKAAEPVEEQPKKSLLGKLKTEKPQESPEAKQAREREAKKAQAKEAEQKAIAKKNRFQFFKEVRSELKRVTWPSKQDVVRWSLVVVAALVFFGVYVAVLDNIIITPLLVAVSGLGA